MLDTDLSRASLLRQVKGSHAINEALRGVEFPISKPDLVLALQGHSIDLGDTRALLADIVRGVPRAKFDDAISARKAVDARWASFAKNLAAIEKAERSRTDDAR